MSDVQAPAQPTAGPARPGAVRRFVNLVGVDNLSLIVALAILGGAHPLRQPARSGSRAARTSCRGRT